MARKKEAKARLLAEGIGEVAFLVGILLAVISAFLTAVEPMLVKAVLAVLGVIVGLLNIRQEETAKFLIAALVLLVPGVTASKFIEVELVNNILVNIATFVWPAAVIVALKTVWDLASRK